MYTLDASVHISALNPAESASADSQAFLDQVQRRRLPLFCPTLLLVEVADTSAEFDRTVKLPLYAQAGIVEVWLAKC